jgi:hypothetical protein
MPVNARRGIDSSLGHNPNTVQKAQSNAAMTSPRMAVATFVSTSFGIPILAKIPTNAAEAADSSA